MTAATILSAISLIATIGFMIYFVSGNKKRMQSVTTIHAKLIERESIANGERYTLRFQLEDESIREFRILVQTYPQKIEDRYHLNFSEQQYYDTLPLNQWGELSMESGAFFSFKV